MISTYMVINRLNQREMADLLGVSPATLSGWLSNRRVGITPANLMRIQCVCANSVRNAGYKYSLFQEDNEEAQEPTLSATATATPSSATASASTAPAQPAPPTPNPIEAYRKRVLSAIMKAEDVDIDARVNLCGIVSSVPIE